MKLPKLSKFPVIRIACILWSVVLKNCHQFLSFFFFWVIHYDSVLVTLLIITVSHFFNKCRSSPDKGVQMSLPLPQYSDSLELLLLTGSVSYRLKSLRLVRINSRVHRLRVVGSIHSLLNEFREPNMVMPTVPFDYLHFYSPLSIAESKSNFGTGTQ